MKERVMEERDRIARYGLALLFVLAGATKFTNLGLWQGYEPRLIVNLLPLTAKQLTLIGGVFELSIAAGLIWRKTSFYASALATFWLAAITVQVTRLKLYDLAIRDLGLTFYALTVLTTLWDN